MSRYVEMQTLDGPQSRVVKTAPVLVVVVAATIIGTTSGILIADRNAFLLLKKNIASHLDDVRNHLFGSADTANAKPETPNIITTGLSSIAAIYYSSKPGSAHVAFDLTATNLVRTGKLRSPDRIYFDLQDRGRKRGTSKRLSTNKSVSITGSLLTGVRISQWKQGTMRIVLDLKRSCDFTYETSPGPPSRLMVDIRPHPAGLPGSE